MTTDLLARRVAQQHAGMVANLRDLCRQQATRYANDKAWIDEKGHTLKIECFNKEEADVCLKIAREEFPHVPITVSWLEFGQ